MPLQDRRDEALLKRVFRQFALLSVGLIALVVVGIVAVAEVQADRSAEGDATTRGEVVAAAVNAGFGDAVAPPADPDFADAIEQVATGAGVRAVLVWDETGRVVWSTRTVFIAERFELSDQVRALFGTSTSQIVEDGTTARPAGLLGNEVEVFAPVEIAQGRSLVVASYVDAATLETTADTLQLLVPLGIAGAAVFATLVLLAGAQLARRVQASRRERIKLLTDSLAAIDHERRRLAHDLHDGVIQDLAAMRYAIIAVTESIPVGLPGDPRSHLGRVSDLIEEELVGLRSMLGDLLPVERDQSSLPHTLHVLLSRLVPTGVTWSVAIDPDLGMLESGSAELVQRVVQEAVRNAIRHAAPRSVQVRVFAIDGGPEPRLRVEVDDDGDASAVTGAREGHRLGTAGDHVGLRLLGDLVRDLDGDLSLTPRPAGGTRLTAQWIRVPRDHPIGSRRWPSSPSELGVEQPMPG